ncbi:hypothetical protein GCM10009566_75350 [Streptomyces murinus]
MTVERRVRDSLRPARVYSATLITEFYKKLLRHAGRVQER